MIFIRARYYREAKDIARRLQLPSPGWRYLGVESLRGTRGATVYTTSYFCWTASRLFAEAYEIEQSVWASEARVIEVACR